MQNRKGKAAYDPYDLLALESGTSRTIHSVTGPAQLAAQNYKYHAGATDGGRPGKGEFTFSLFCIDNDECKDDQDEKSKRFDSSFKAKGSELCS
jgi:hypothetical protein